MMASMAEIPFNHLFLQPEVELNPKYSVLLTCS